MSEVTYIPLPEGFLSRVRDRLAVGAKETGIRLGVGSVAETMADADALALSLAKIATEAVVGELVAAGLMTLSDPG